MITNFISDSPKELIKLDFEQIASYLSCPLKYKFKYVDKIPAPERQQSLDAKLSICMHKVIYHLFYTVLNGSVASTDKLRNKWEEAWFDGESIADTQYHHKSEKMKLGYQGLSMLGNMYRQFVDNPGFIIGVDLQLDDVRIGNGLITTHIELIREVEEDRNKSVEIIDFRTGTILPDTWSAMTDLRMTMQSYAFRKIFSAIEQRNTLWYLRQNKQIYTMRTAQQFKRLEDTVNAVIHNINNECFYPRETVMCKGCEYRNICTSWPC